MESNYKVVASATSKVIWVEALLTTWNYQDSPPVKRFDNIGAMYLSSNPIFHARTKQVEFDFHFVRELGCVEIVTSLVCIIQRPSC